MEAHRLYLDKVYNQKSPGSVTISDDGRGSVEPDNDHERDGQENGSDSKLTKRLSEGRVRSLDNRQRICHSSFGEETDTADELPLKPLGRRSEREGTDGFAECFKY